jgi:trigger factor
MDSILDPAGKEVEQEHKLSSEIVQINGCKRNLVAEIPSAQVDREVDDLARKYARKAKVPGFRPGKVPLNIIKQRYLSDLRSDATHEIIQRCWKDAVEEHHLEPITEPVVENVKDEAGTPLRFTLAFEVLPSLEIKDYKGIAVTIESMKIADPDVEKAIEALREQHAQYVPVEEGEARDGCMVTLTLDGVFEDGSKPIHEDDVTLIIGSPETNETFSENLRGAKAGETRAFDVSYPEDYHRRKFAGKKVRYSAVIKEMKEKHLSEPGDDFAKDLGAVDLADLRTKIRNELVTKGERTAEKKSRETLIDDIVQRNPFDVPDCLVQDELKDHARRIASNLAHQGIDVNKISIDWKKIFEEERPNAEKAVRRSMVLDAVARQESFEITEAELEAEFEKIAQGTGKSAAAVRAKFEKDKKIQGFTEHLRQNKALDFIFRNANITRG